MSWRALVPTLCLVLAACGSSASEPAATSAPEAPAPSAPEAERVTTAREEPASNEGEPEEPETGRTEAPEAAPPRDPDAPAPCPPEEAWPEGMACVRGGTFELGDPQGRPDEKEPGEVYVDTFFMDLYEVTNERYEACIEAGECDRPMPFRGYMGPTQPVVAVSWYDANDFCEMLGRRLPTEAEWERAAAGPDDTRYPWGDEPLGCERANIENEQGRGCGRDRTRPVGSYEPGHWGLYDMAGNVHEWVRDWYSPCLRGCENECGDACFGRNPQGPCDGEIGRCDGYRLRSVRGGSWYWPLERARASARRGSGAPNRGPHRFGFRCARDIVVEDETVPSLNAPENTTESGEADED